MTSAAIQSLSAPSICEKIYFHFEFPQNKPQLSKNAMLELEQVILSSFNITKRFITHSRINLILCSSKNKEKDGLLELLRINDELVKSVILTYLSTSFSIISDFLVNNNNNDNYNNDNNVRKIIFTWIINKTYFT